MTEKVRLNVPRLVKPTASHTSATVSDPLETRLRRRRWRCARRAAPRERYRTGRARVSGNLYPSR